MATPQAAGGGAAHAEALQALLGSLMSQAFGNQTVPLLRTVLVGKIPNVVNPRTSVRDAGSKMTDNADRSTDQFDGADAVIFKVTDPNSNIHRVRCVPRLSTLCKMVAGKIGGGTDPSSLQIQFVDDEGDIVLVTTDEDLGEAVSISKASGQKAVKIKVVFGKNGLSAMLEDPVMLGIAGAVVVGVVVLGFVLSRR